MNNSFPEKKAIEKDQTIALYAFSPVNEPDLKYHTSEASWDGYVQYFEDALARMKGK